MNRCFVICPFGEEALEERERSDNLFELVIRPVTEKAGYTVFRTIDDAQPGDITARIIREIYEAELVIADLTGSNPNVFYELALRHSIAKPFILLSEDTSGLPFNVAQLDVINIKNFMTLNRSREIEKSITDQLNKIKRGLDCTNVAWSLRPENKGRASKWFTWRICYSRKVASEWLKRQDEAIRDFIARYNKDESTLSENKEYLKETASYDQYKQYQGQNLEYELFYTLNPAGGFVGWAIYDDKSPNPRTIRVWGSEYSDGKVEMRFHQHSRVVHFGGEDVTLDGYQYAIVFQPHPQTGVLEGKLVHPDYPAEQGREQLLVGATELRQP